MIECQSMHEVVIKNIIGAMNNQATINQDPPRYR